MCKRSLNVLKLNNKRSAIKLLKLVPSRWKKNSTRPACQLTVYFNHWCFSSKQFNNRRTGWFEINYYIFISSMSYWESTTICPSMKLYIKLNTCHLYLKNNFRLSFEIFCEKKWNLIDTVDKLMSMNFLSLFLHNWYHKKITFEGQLHRTWS